MLDLRFAVLLLAAKSTPPPGSDELRWVKALYPAGKIEGEAITRVARAMAFPARSGRQTSIR